MVGFDERKRLTFEQAEGAEPLPAQLQLRTLSPQLRSALWALVFEIINRGAGRNPYVSEPWGRILKADHVFRLHRPVDEFSPYHKDVCDGLKPMFMTADYIQVFGFLQFVIREAECPPAFAQAVNGCLELSRAAYRVVDETIVPIGSEQELATIETAFADIASAEFNGARAHLRKAAEELTAGHYADSIRESINAVEATARVLEPSGSLNGALGRLEKSAGIHKALKHGFANLYGYTSDEKGIRHALLDDGTAKVDEADALFMIGACAAFVSYLINKARAVGILSGA
jgi:hypothetical protein